MRTRSKNWLMAFMLISTLFLSSCGMIQRVHYVGDSYSPNDNVDTFYDPADIDRDFKTMGHLMSMEFTPPFMLETLQKDMINEAKRRGADAIVFEPFEPSVDLDANNEFRLKAQLIRYTYN